MRDPRRGPVGDQDEEQGPDYHDQVGALGAEGLLQDVPEQGVPLEVVEDVQVSFYGCFYLVQDSQPDGVLDRGPLYDVAL